MRRGGALMSLLALLATACATSVAGPRQASERATPASATAAARAPEQPGALQIRAALHGLVAADSPTDYFERMADPVSTPDGFGGWLTAVVAVHHENGDGHGLIVAFWHDARFVGWVPDREVAAIGDPIPAGPAAFTVPIDVYGPQSPMCCPSGSVSVVYRWNGTRFVSDRPLPPDVVLGPRVVRRA